MRSHGKLIIKAKVLEEVAMNINQNPMDILRDIQVLSDAIKEAEQQNDESDTGKILMDFLKGIKNIKEKKLEASKSQAA